MRRLALVLALTSTGCVQTWGLGDVDGPAAPSSPSASARDPEADAFRRLARELAVEEARADEAIAAAVARGEDPVALRRRRLAILVALSGLRADGPRLAPPPSLEEAVTQAERELAQAGDAVVLEEEPEEQEGERARATGTRNEDDFGDVENLPLEDEGGLFGVGEGGGGIGKKKDIRAQRTPRQDPLAGLDLGGPPPVRAAVVVAPSGGDEIDVAQALQPQRVELAQCLDTPGEAVDLTVRARVSSDGSFREIRVLDRSLLPRARACLADRLRRVRMPLPPGTDATVLTFSLSLRSR
ncbi:MAG: hypothetical protein KC731_33520 [Myxococcales bacterium]|nr:hypothetical protein [Myxococcales bacterium]